MEFLNVILQGNCLTELKKIPTRSANCCVTSPPYYGLRDYGTGKWIGGDINCSHKGNPIKIRENINLNCGTGIDVKNALHFEPYKTTCLKCGASRVDEQVGLEESPEEYIENLVKIFREVRRILTPDGTLWLNIADSYNGSGKANGDKHINGYKQDTNKASHDVLPTKIQRLKPKDLIGIPWLLALALRNDGWYLRQDIIWQKPNPMPESVKDRCTKSHEYIFLLSKQKKYYYDHKSIMVEAAYDGRKDTRMKGSHKYANGVTGLTSQTFSARGHERWTMKDGKYMKNKRSVWTVPTKPFKEAHFATFPEDLIIDCIKAGCPEGGIVLDPFLGSGTTAAVARKLNRNYIGVELNPEYIQIAEKRINSIE